VMFVSVYSSVKNHPYDAQAYVSGSIDF
jgi:hypothetical protein